MVLLQALVYYSNWYPVYLPQKTHSPKVGSEELGGKLTLTFTSLIASCKMLLIIEALIFWNELIQGKTSFKQLEQEQWPQRQFIFQSKVWQIYIPLHSQSLWRVLSLIHQEGKFTLIYILNKHYVAYYTLALCKPLCARVFSRVRLFAGDPMGCSPPGSSVHGIFQARILE